ncbi:MAG TPA: RNA polymerase sigma factor [Rhodocyclaceae bacterium]|nr:RNA polymerase sigma factor [Rhodocyclaceae bacterium]
MTREELLRLYPAHRGKLMAALSRLVGPTEAEDLAQETLLRALAAVEGFRGDAALGTWLHRIGINLAYDLLRRRSASPILPAEDIADLPEPAIDATATAGLELRQTNRCIRNMLATLPPEQQEVLLQAELYDRTAAEIARDAGITPGNAKIRLQRARRALKAALAKNCALYHGAAGELLCTPKR